MKITYWTGFSKRKNSTKQPTSGTEIDVVLKDNCSILNPVFECVGIPANVNYIYCADFGRYYYVSGVAHDGPHIIIDCECDVLATYKSQIGSTSALVEFTSSSSDIKISDGRNKPTVTFEEKSSNLLDLGAWGFTTSGCIVVSIAGADGIEYYVVSDAEFEDLYTSIYAPTFINNVENQFFGTQDCILGAMWLPYTPGVGGATFIRVAGQATSAQGFPIVSRLATIAENSYSVFFPSDDLGYGTNYLDQEPFSTGTLYLPYVGVVPLDLGVVGKSKQIKLSVALDNYLGEIVYRISNESGDYVATYSGKCGVNIPISAQSFNATGAAGGIISTIGGIASTIAAVAAKNPALAMTSASNAIGGAVAAAQSMSLHTQVNGSLSSAVATELGLKAKATVITRTPTETNLTAFQTVLGMPYYKVATISSLAGYVQCFNASVNCAGYPEEKDRINGYVNGGFYYE